MRRSLSTTQRLHLFLKAQGHCQACGWRLSPGTRWEVDHIISVALGGSDRPENLQVLCAACHGSKTATADVPALSKAKRVQARHLGARRSEDIIAGSRRSGFKKKVNGQVVRRSPLWRSPP